MSDHTLLWSVAAAAILLGGSGCSEEKVAETKPVLPWKWEPEDPELISGKEVYNKTCHLCHNEGEESAPMLTDHSEWEERIVKGETTLVKNAIEGFWGDDGEMPSRGGNDSYSDEQITAAVKFMIAAPKHH